MSLVPEGMSVQSYNQTRDPPDRRNEPIKEAEHTKYRRPAPEMKKSFDQICRRRRPKKEIETSGKPKSLWYLDPSQEIVIAGHCDKNDQKKQNAKYRQIESLDNRIQLGRSTTFVPHDEVPQAVHLSPATSNRSRECRLYKLRTSSFPNRRRTNSSHGISCR